MNSRLLVSALAAPGYRPYQFNHRDHRGTQPDSPIREVASTVRRIACEVELYDFASKGINGGRRVAFP
jgi:hypothetical protein